MFNIYIYDYCTKRGFNKTANELKTEAELGDDAHPPINAKQGLLFEWWSVFWQLFGAKSQGNGSEDALLYTQHQQQQAAQRDRRPLNVNPASQQPRMQNGQPAPRPPVTLVPNGAMANGVVPGPLPGGQGPQSGPFNGVNNQMNGMTNGTTATAPSPAQSGTFAPMVPNPRPMNAQQRGPNGMGPFQSPTMAHSPQNPGQQHPSGPMSQLGTPQMANMNRGGMLPPNGTQGGMPNSAHHTPQPSFRSPSRPSTPGQNSLVHASPSLANRPNPGNMAGSDMRQVEALNNELRTIAPQLMHQIKQETGLADKDPQQFTMEEKQRIIQVHRQKRMQKPPGQPNAVAGPSGTPMMPPNAQRIQPNQQQQPGQGQGLAPGQQRSIKRNSTSPAEEDAMPRTDSSPPDRKRIRRSPNPEQQQQGHQPQQQSQPMVPFTHAVPQPGGPPGPHNMPNGMMRPPQLGGPPLGNFPGQPGMQNMGNNPGMNMGMSQMGAGGMSAMSPGMLNHQGQGGMMNPAVNPQQAYAYRQSMANLHKNGLPPGTLNMLPNQNTASPQANDGGFNPDGSQRPQTFPGGVPQNRMPGAKMSGMPPPPSPAMNGMAKGPPGGPKQEPGNEQGSASGPTSGSPRNAAGGIGQGQNQQQSNQGQPSTAPPTPAGNGLTTPSPAQIINSTAPGMNTSTNTADSITASLFDDNFMAGMGGVNASFGDLDPTLFGLRETDINFERDFGQWFNPDDVGLDIPK
ncbi:hypothetical protein NEOLEDRAFT_1140017 [Neolentinus lepideus HHB14362 ss-1]|uniref:LisH domain-containing protein n=1 Tax=Neolentinus lepideus HHB14362 ss-1 TaxID=1314782 RepID=A0A165PFZ7_9AGAM|nr:hypothetical protein NEOLEDRAFT_1140017 [Neolentinus lepideus HHB14362 ss-1]